MIHQSDLTDIQTTFFECADKIIAYRKQNGGMLPKEIWLKLLELNGRNFCLEILCTAKDGRPILKRRADASALGGEQEWEGKLHIPGMTVSLSIRATDMVKELIRKEIVKENNEDLVEQLTGRSAIWGFMMYAEPERKTTSDTLMIHLELDLSDPRIQDDLEEVTPETMVDVISQHVPVLELYKRQPLGNAFLDTRTDKEMCI